MKNEPAIKTYSARDLERRRARGESRTDAARVRRQSPASLQEAIATDPDWSDVPADWQEKAKAVMPVPKRLLSLRLDEDVVTWFRARGPGYQTRINAVLRAFIAQQGRG